MLRINKFIIFALICASAANAFTLEREKKDAVKSVVGMLISCRYAGAFKTVDSLMLDEPSEPLWHLLSLFNLGLKIMDYNAVADSAEFMESYLGTINAVYEYEKINGPSSYSLTLSGFADATHAAYFLYQNKYFSAIGTGLEAVKTLNRAVEMDSSNYDADLFLGMYDYAKSELKKKLWMIMFWYPGSKRDGIRRLEKCSVKAEISSSAAELALIDIYIQEELFEKAKKSIDTMLSKYPSSRFVLWSKAKYFEKLKDYKSSAEVYGLLAKSYEADPQGEYNSLVTRQNQIELLMKSDMKQDAESVARGVVEFRREIADRRSNSIYRKIQKISGINDDGDDKNR